MNYQKYSNNAGTIPIIYTNYAKNALDVYEKLNPQNFDDILCFDIFKNSLDIICKAHNQFPKITVLDTEKQLQSRYEDQVLLACSGGLDSIYQAFILSDKYKVNLFHVRNMNYYTNGKEYQVVKEFSEKYNFPLIVVDFKQNIKNNSYKKYWKENSFKNILLYSLMIDYCNLYSIGNISSGDDLGLDIKDAIVGTNIADARQVTLPFINNIEDKLNIHFIPTQRIHKGERIKLLEEKGALDLFYSCVNPGRFNQCNHNRIEKKYNIKLEKWNCGVCRKCAYHSLLQYYYLHKQLPKEFIDFCWQKICIGADYEFFKPELPLEIRVKNLFNY